MNMKKELIEKITLCILTFVLIIYISSILVTFSVFNISQKFLNKESVYGFINTVDITSILKDELGNELKEITVIKDSLSEVGISSEGVNQFINSNEVKEFSVDVATKIFNRVFDLRNTNYQITNEQLSDLIKNNVDKLEANSSLSENQILKKIESKIPDLVLNINKLLDKFCEELENSQTFQKYQGFIYSSINILDFIYSDFVSIIITFILISFILLLVFIRKSMYKSLKWLSISFFIPSLIFGITSTYIFSFVNVNNILFNNILNIINKNLINYSIIYFVISFILLSINITIYIIKKYKDKEKVSYE